MSRPFQQTKRSENAVSLSGERFHEETAKLVATCTAATTAALLATRQVPTYLQITEPGKNNLNAPIMYTHCSSGSSS